MLVVATALAVYLADQGTKVLVTENLRIGESVPAVGELLKLTYVTNSGAAFSIASGFTWILSILAAIVVVAIIWFARRIRIRSRAWAVMLGLVLGGAVGNLTDRLLRPPGFGRGEVVDFLQLWGFPAIFNLADVAVCAGVGVFLVLTLRGIHLDGTRGHERDPEPAAEPSDPAEPADPADPAEATGPGDDASERRPGR